MSYRSGGSLFIGGGLLNTSPSGCSVANLRTKGSRKGSHREEGSSRAKCLEGGLLQKQGREDIATRKIFVMWWGPTKYIPPGSRGVTTDRKESRKKKKKKTKKKKKKRKKRKHRLKYQKKKKKKKKKKIKIKK